MVDGRTTPFGIVAVCGGGGISGSDLGCLACLWDRRTGPWSTRGEVSGDLWFEGLCPPECRDVAADIPTSPAAPRHTLQKFSRNLGILVNFNITNKITFTSLPSLNNYTFLRSIESVIIIDFLSSKIITKN